VGSGEDTLVWEEPWIPDVPSFKPRPRSPDDSHQCITVAQLMVQDKSNWDDLTLRNLFYETTIAAIHNILRWSMGHKDKWIWLYSNSGTVIVKSAYKVGTREDHSTPSDPILGKIWKQNIHVRLKMSLWRVALNLLPTKTSLSRFAPDLDTTCPLCGEHTESTIHLLWQCSLARAL
jgi:hypothetical protein